MTTNEKTTRYYSVAEHVMAVTATADIFTLMDNYSPFETEPQGDVLMTIDINDGNGDGSMPEEWTEEWRQEEDGDEIACGRTGNGSAFIFLSQGKTAGKLLCSADYHKAEVFIGNMPKLAIDNAMMVSYALATANENTLLFHSSVVSRNGKAYMFLGPSGTGKSTHTRLWLKYIEGSHLLNDDNPVVRINNNGEAWVYGTPWSGKTPCYRNEQYPLAAVVRLSQAPHNSIRKMSNLEAYITMSSSISGKRWDKGIADGLHRTLNALTAKTDVWFMECLPDEAAAIMTSKTI